MTPSIARSWSRGVGDALDHIRGLRDPTICGGGAVQEMGVIEAVDLGVSAQLGRRHNPTTPESPLQ